MSGFEPVLLEVRRVCAFVAKPCALCGLPKSNRAHTPKKRATCRFKRQNGCATCGLPKGHRDHYGEPPSLNFFSTGALTGPLLSSLKTTWQGLLYGQLLASDLPTGLARVVVEGEIVFPAAARRDQGNFRFIPEKALGDALQQIGPDGRPWLADDSWDHYQFGNLTYRVLPGESATRLTLFPDIDQMELTV